MGNVTRHIRHSDFVILSTFVLRNSSFGNRMNVTFCCPVCDQTARVDLGAGPAAMACTHCGQEVKVPAGAISGGELRRCLVCPSTELFVRKDFPQRLGVAIVVLGFAASCVSWHYYRIYLTFGILCATALVDVVLYAIMGECLTCYRCGAQYRSVEGLEKHAGFDLAIHERYRQQAARLAQQPAAGRANPSGH
jgi:hypothetical protein